MAKFQTIFLTDNEKEIFERDWESVWQYDLSYNPELHRMYSTGKSAILFTCEVAKYHFKRSFGGVFAWPNEFGWTNLLPHHIGTKETKLVPDPPCEENGWVEWIGTPEPFVVPPNAMILILGVMDNIDTPKIDAISLSIDNTEYPVWYLTSLKEAHFRTSKLPTPIHLKPNSRLTVKARAIAPGPDNLRLIGVYFGTGDHLRERK